MSIDQDFFSKHGGVHFLQLAEAEEINEFVRNLPEKDRLSLYDVCQKLSHAGLVELMNDGTWTDGHGQVGGSQTCGDE